MNKLDLFYKKIENILIIDTNLNSQLIMLRSLMKDYLFDADFKLLCVNEILNSIEDSLQRGVSWISPHLFYHNKLNFSVRIICWPAFYDNNPHQHKTWSVTGVFHNHLNVYTYSLLENPMRLKKIKSIFATVDDVGYLMPGCIHNVSNPSHEVSASFHIFNNIDIDNPEENAIWYPAPRKYNLSNGLLERTLNVCLGVVEGIDSDLSFNIIKRIYGFLPINYKISAIYAMYKYDRCYAKNCFDEVGKSFYSSY